MLRWGGCCEGRAEGRQSVRGRLLYNYRNNHFEKRKEKEQNLHFDKLFCFCFASQAGVRRGQKYLSSIFVSVCNLLHMARVGLLLLLMLSYIVAFCEIGPGLQMRIVVGVECWAQRYEFEGSFWKRKMCKYFGYISRGLSEEYTINKVSNFSNI